MYTHHIMVYIIILYYSYAYLSLSLSIYIYIYIYMYLVAQAIREIALLKDRLSVAATLFHQVAFVLQHIQIMYVCVHIYIYMYIYTYTHITHTYHICCMQRVCNRQTCTIYMCVYRLHGLAAAAVFRA